VVNLLFVNSVRVFDGKKLRAVRKAMRLSQSELGRRIGAHVTSISDWERGENSPSGRHVAGLARELGVTVGDLYGDAAAEDDEESDEPLSREQMDLYLTLHARLQRHIARVASEFETS
jgi:transcriptional regulator with XRE-family HTH domain